MSFIFFITIFLSFLHETHENVGCISCHNFENPKPTIKTTDKSCSQCHQNEITLTLPNKINYSTKFKHSNHSFLECSSCHKKERELKADGMKKCVSCHKKEECSSCHYYQSGYFKKEVNGKKFTPESHKKSSFQTKHTTTNEKECLQCHQKTECISCHTARRRDSSFHPSDYLSFHKYEKEFNSCNSCHKNGESCSSCHQKSGLDSEEKYGSTFKRDFNIHPTSFKDNHKREARKNIQKCMSCHKESDCLSCHKALNPHKKGGDPCRNVDATKKSCIKCHQDGSKRCNNN